MSAWKPMCAAGLLAALAAVLAAVGDRSTHRDRYWEAIIEHLEAMREAGSSSDLHTVHRSSVDEAVAACDHAIAIDPGVYLAYGRRAEALILLGEYERALNDLRTADSMYDEDSPMVGSDFMFREDIWWLMARCERRCGNPEAALRTLERAGTVWRLGTEGVLANRALGRDDEAKSVVASMLADGASDWMRHEGHLLDAVLALDADDLRQASASLRASADIQHRDPRWKLWIQHMQTRVEAGNRETAIEDLITLLERRF